MDLAAVAVDHPVESEFVETTPAFCDTAFRPSVLQVFFFLALSSRLLRCLRGPHLCLGSTVGTGCIVFCQGVLFCLDDAFAQILRRLSACAEGFLDPHLPCLGIPARLVEHLIGLVQSIVVVF
jgi:hypothetical protein